MQQARDPFFSSETENVATLNNDTNLTILNAHKQRTDKLSLIDVANEFAALNEN